MTVTLPSDVQKLVEEQIATGAYSTVEDVLRAGVAALVTPQSIGDFAPGELDAILAKAVERYRERGGRPAEEVFADLRQRSLIARESKP